MRLKRIELVEDRSARSRCDEGFLRVRRIRLRNHYDDGSQSRDYSCDYVHRETLDAVAVVLYQRDASGGVRVVLRQGLRAPAFFRREMDLQGVEEPEFLQLYELVAGILEPEDLGLDGVRRRAAIEAKEEAGYELDPASVELMGAAIFPSPGMTPERIHIAAAELDLDQRGPAEGDGSPMEEGAVVSVVSLEEALEKCRQGGIVDAKTEIGLRRLAERLG